MRPPYEFIWCHRVQASINPSIHQSATINHISDYVVVAHFCGQKCQHESLKQKHRSRCLPRLPKKAGRFTWWFETPRSKDDIRALWDKLDSQICFFFFSQVWGGWKVIGIMKLLLFFLGGKQRMQMDGEFLKEISWNFYEFLQKFVQFFGLVPMSVRCPRCQKVINSSFVSWVLACRIHLQPGRSPPKVWCWACALDHLWTWAMNKNPGYLL